MQRFLRPALVLLSLVLFPGTSFTQPQDPLFRCGCPYYSHLFIDTIHKDSDPLIPCQSVYDVRIAARLGFRYVEANLHPTATQGKYVVMHGYRGTIGYQLEDLDGNPAPDVVIAQTPFDTLRTKYRYRSRDPKYRTPVTSLEEFLHECRSCGVAPLVQYVDQTSLSIIRGIMGEDYILYGGRRELGHDGMIMEYKSFPTVEGVVGQCRWMGAPYMYCMGNVSAFSDAQLREIVLGAHSCGCYVGFAGCYESPETSSRLFSLGFDFSASGWDINEIRSGNLCNLSLNDNVSLKAGEPLKIRKKRLGKPFLSGASLRIAFKGTLHIKMGPYIDSDFTGDGSSIHLSTYFLEDRPDFSIYAVTDAEVTYLTYRVSEF
ncbi:MAG: hypothetical protein ACI395_08065 [Candidatus Cryptobacteroides sp.]